MTVPLIEPNGANSGGDTSNGQYYAMDGAASPRNGPYTTTTAATGVEGTAVIFQSEASKQLVLGPDDLFIILLVIQLMLSLHITLTNK